MAVVQNYGNVIRQEKRLFDIPDILSGPLASAGDQNCPNLSAFGAVQRILNGFGIIFPLKARFVD